MASQEKLIFPKDELFVFRIGKVHGSGGSSCRYSRDAMLAEALNIDFAKCLQAMQHRKLLREMPLVMGLTPGPWCWSRYFVVNISIPQLCFGAGARVFFTVCPVQY